MGSEPDGPAGNGSGPVVSFSVTSGGTGVPEPAPVLIERMVSQQESSSPVDSQPRAPA